MPRTARAHFDDDLSRAEAVVDEADRLPASRGAVATDLRRAGVALAVGALDAYLCDAYIDCLTCCLRAYRQGTCSKLPADYAKELLPAGPLFAQHYRSRSNWALRMAARARMERENLLQVGRVKGLFNPILPPQQKLWIDVIDRYTALGRRRLTSYRANDIALLPANQQLDAQKKAAAALIRRIGAIVQRRHDIVHNVDRPKVSPQAISAGQTKAMVRDIRDFIQILDGHLDGHRLW
jgi:hypothetical protein